MPSPTQPQRPDEQEETKSVYVSAIRQEMRTMEGIDAMAGNYEDRQPRRMGMAAQKTYRERNHTDTAIAGLQDRPSHHRIRRAISNILVRRPHDKFQQPCVCIRGSPVAGYNHERDC